MWQQVIRVTRRPPQFGFGRNPQHRLRTSLARKRGQCEPRRADLQDKQIRDCLVDMQRAGVL